MLRRIRGGLTYANVMATIAVFVALGGASYAVVRVDSGDIKNNTIRSKDVRNGALRGRDLKANTLTGRQVIESRLGTVRRATDATRAQSAANADRVGGAAVADLKVRCPVGTRLVVAGCFEETPRPAQVHNAAAGVCGREGRRLPTYAELLGLFQTTPPNLAEPGELTANVYFEDAVFRVVVMTDSTGAAPTSIPAGAAGNERPFRCVAAPLN